eukprot:jgi/Hompol1/4343/HPOL_003606-RA
MDDMERCPVCKTDKYLNPTLRLLVSPCFHKMCESCINRLFLSGPAPCPICKATLRKSNFVFQTFDDLLVEKEIQIRKKIGRYFNKRLEDFDGNLRAYNDYLEEVEEIMFNLIHDIDLQNTQERIDRYRIENKEIIEANMSRQRREDQYNMQRLERERLEKHLRKEAYEKQAIDEFRSRKQQQNSMIDQLASSNTEVDAKTIVREAQARMQQQPALEVHINLDEIMDTDTADPMLDDGPYEPFDGLYSTPVYYASSTTFNDPMSQIFKAEDRASLLRAGGAVPAMAQQYALYSAFSGIFDSTSSNTVN